MSAKKEHRGSMKSFVEQRHAANNPSRQPPQTSHHLDDYKVDTNGVARAANISSKHVAHEVRESHPTQFDTDGSAADDTSNGISNGQGQRPRRGAEPYTDDLLQRYPESDTSEDRNADEGAEEFPKLNLSSLTKVTTHLGRRLQESQNSPTLTSRYLPGDSYPTTSAGNLSQDALSRMDRHEARTRQMNIEEWRQGSKSQSLSTGGPPSPPLGNRELPYGTFKPWPTEMQNRKSRVAAHVEQQSPSHTVLEDVAVHPSKSRRVHRKQKQPDLGTDDWLSNVAQADQLHSTSRDDLERIVAADASQLHTASLALGDDEIGTSPTITGQLSPVTKSRRAKKKPRPEQRREPSPDLVHDTQSDVSDPTDPEETINADKNRLLDYDMETLGNMDYNAIKSAHFDQDPNVEQLTLPGLSDDTPLADQMVAASRLPPKSQADFFATLDIETWENAGDWFVDRFGEILSQLKHARQKKRQCARTFEDEIERRHVVVTKRLKMTDSVFAEMKENGGKILQCTPKRAAQGKGMDG